jgi:hypothetical protein
MTMARPVLPYRPGVYTIPEKKYIRNQGAN